LTALAEDSLVESEDEIVVGLAGDESVDDVKDRSWFTLMHYLKYRIIPSRVV
jgi:hypothetical protein